MFFYMCGKGSSFFFSDTELLNFYEMFETTKMYERLFLHWRIESCKWMMRAYSQFLSSTRIWPITWPSSSAFYIYREHFPEHTFHNLSYECSKSSQKPAAFQLYLISVCYPSLACLQLVLFSQTHSSSQFLSSCVEWKNAANIESQMWHEYFVETRLGSFLRIWHPRHIIIAPGLGGSTIKVPFSITINFVGLWDYLRPEKLE